MLLHSPCNSQSWLAACPYMGARTSTGDIYMILVFILCCPMGDTSERYVSAPEASAPESVPAHAPCAHALRPCAVRPCGSCRTYPQPTALSSGSS